MIPIRHHLSLIAAVCLLAGCASTPDSGALFLLDQPGNGTTSRQAVDAEPIQATLTLSQTELAPYLTRDGIVYQTGPNRIVVASRNLWAAPLESQLAAGLYDALDQGLPGVDVRHAGLTASGPSGFDLFVHIERFQGRYDGNAVISGNWRLFDASGRVAGRGQFAQTTPLQADGYAALVRALSRGWQTVKQSLVDAVGAALRAK